MTGPNPKHSPALTGLQEDLLNRLVQWPEVDFKEQYDYAALVLNEVRAAIAKKLGPSLSRHLQESPQETLEECRVLASDTNARLRDLSLGLRCPVSGRSASLIADVKHTPHSDIVRYRYEITDENGQRRRSFTTRTLPETIELMVAPARIEGLSRTHRAVRGDQHSR